MDRMFTYGEAEALLAKLHGADRELQIGAFRSRLKHLKKLGVPMGSNPGKGKKIEYSREVLYQWVFCLECSQFGLDPTWTVAVVKHLWPKYYQTLFLRAERHDVSGLDDLYMVMFPLFMTAAWKQPPGEEARLIDPGITAVPQSKLADVFRTVGRDYRRLCLLNLSEVIRMIQMAERDLPRRRSTGAAR